MQDWQIRLRHESQCPEFQTTATTILAERFAHPGREEAMKVKGGEIRHARERVEVERLVQMAIDVFEDAVHASRVLGTEVGGCHAGSAYSSSKFHCV